MKDAFHAAHEGGPFLIGESTTNDGQIVLGRQAGFACIFQGSGRQHLKAGGPEREVSGSDEIAQANRENLF